MDILYSCVVIASGLVLFGINLRFIAKKQMDVSIGSAWAIMALVVFIFGVSFDFSILRHITRFMNILLVYIFCVSLVVALYYYGLRVSELKKRNDEVAIWLSILKTEHDDGRAHIGNTAKIMEENAHKHNHIDIDA